MSRQGAIVGEIMESGIDGVGRVSVEIVDQELRIAQRGGNFNEYSAPVRIAVDGSADFIRSVMRLYSPPKAKSSTHGATPDQNPWDANRIRRIMALADVDKDELSRLTGAAVKTINDWLTGRYPPGEKYWPALQMLERDVAKVTS